MPAKTGAQYVSRLSERPCEVWLRGERIEDVTTHPALRNGAVASCRAEGALLELVRETDDERIVCRFNLSAEALALHDTPEGEILCTVNQASPTSLGPYAAILLRA